MYCSRGHRSLMCKSYVPGGHRTLVCIVPGVASAYAITLVIVSWILDPGIKNEAKHVRPVSYTHLTLPTMPDV